MARDAEAFAIIDDAGTRLIRTEPFPGAPELRAYFTIDSPQACTLRWIELQLPPDPEQEDFTD